MAILQSVKSTCPYCGVGCGVITTLDEYGVVTVEGDPDHPANFGRLCSKGSALGETVYLQERLLYPEINNEQVSWEQALSSVASGFEKVIEEHGADAVAFYVSGQLMTEDYYVANKLMKGFIGSGNIDTNSRLCMSSPVAAHKRSFGEDCVPGNYEDLEKAKLIVLVGTNAAWCHPVLFQRIVKARKQNLDLIIITIDPRKTQTASVADIHLAIRPGTDAFLFNGLLSYMDRAGECNELFTKNFTEGLTEALKVAKETAPSVDAVAKQCGLDVNDVEEFYRIFARTERAVTVYSQGINQSSSGVDKIHSIINCHLFTGRIGRPGMGPLSFTGQPNAMGGREVGGLANQLAAHMEINNEQHQATVQEFWQSPTIAKREGLKAVDLFEAINQGTIKAVWIMATNPAVSMPDAKKVKAALKKCELVVVSDCVAGTDTSLYADIKLPALTWGERDGTVTNSERRISRQRAILPQPGQAKPDWWIISQVAQFMGHKEAFDYRVAADIFREHAALSGFKNAGARQFDISLLQNVTNKEYDEIAPIQWPITTDAPEGTPRIFSDGHFSTPNHKARFFPIVPQGPAESPNEQYPLILNTGRVRDHWHTMTRTGMSPRLSAHTYESYAEIHPQDARKFGVKDGELSIVSSELGEIFVRVNESEKQLEGSLFVPMHWNNQFSSNSSVGDLIKTVTDPVSGQPEFKHAIVTISPCKANWHGFILSRRHDLKLEYSTYWARSRGKGLWRYEIAGIEEPADWATRARALLCNKEDPSWAEYFDVTNTEYRAARFVGDRLESCVFIEQTVDLPERDWLIGLFQKSRLTKLERASILSGEPPKGQPETGKIICSCFNVGETTLTRKIIQEGLKTTEEIGACLQAGTNCGSCIPELKELLMKS